MHKFSAIDVVDNPSVRYEFDPATRSFRVTDPYGYDALSPPWFLDLTDSMGAYKNDTEFELGFGESILEIRNIRRISVTALREMGRTDEDSKEFLTNDTIPLQKHVIVLFSLLERLFY